MPAASIALEFFSIVQALVSFKVKVKKVANVEEIRNYMAQGLDSSNALTNAIDKIGREGKIGGKAMFGELTL